MAVLFFGVSPGGEPRGPRVGGRRFDAAEDLAEIPLPDDILRIFREEYGDLKGVFEPLPPVKAWRRELVE